MSLKNPKHLLIIGAVVVALMVGTVLLGSYANILPGKSDVSSQVTGSTPCPGAKACPLGRTEPCCAGEATTSCCPAQNSPGQSDEGCCPAKCCPDECENCCCPDECDKCCCPKPCCAGEAATGCCPMPSPS